jgi:hypothetical protein
MGKTSKYAGVSWCKTHLKWRAAISVNNKKISLGYYDIELDAHNAYLIKRDQIRGTSGVDDMDGEIWKPCLWAGISYSISNRGRVKNKNYNHSGIEMLIIPHLHKDGYMEVSIGGNRAFIHRLVCEAFWGYDHRCVNHKDGNKQNNNIENLEYVTQRENVCHSAILRKGKVGYYWNKKNRRWVAAICLNKKAKQIGSFLTEYEAKCAYRKFLMENNIENKYN